jgi:hypothetical protein
MLTSSRAIASGGQALALALSSPQGGKLSNERTSIDETVGVFGFFE